MEFYHQWQFWFALINLIGIIIIGVANYLSHKKIVGNDLHHLATDIKTVINKQEDLNNKIQDVAIDVAHLKGREEINDKVIKLLEKSLSK
jgi:hypothetical protein